MRLIALCPPASFVRLCALGALLALSSLGASRTARASYAFYVGKDLTADGSVLVGGTGEEVSSHWLEIVPARKHAEDATLEVGVTESANIPGERIEIPQASLTYRYIAMFYTDYLGFPPPLTNGGLNEHQVAVRDVWAPSRKELVEMTPTPQRGPQYSDLARIVLERARTAREGVEIIGTLIDAHGYATYGGNTHLIADPNEGWVVWELAGGRGLWAAERLGPDDVRVLYPGYIEEIPLDYADDPGYMGSDNLVDFAEQQGWFDSTGRKTFNVHDVYGKQGVPAREPQAKYRSPKDLEDRLQAQAPVRVEEMMARVRDRHIADDEAGYGQVAHLRDGIPRELGLLWVAPTGSVTAPFIPWWISVREVPPEYGQHRYLTKNAASSFLNPDYQAQEATEFAGRIFKRLMYYTCDHPEVFFDPVTATLEGFEARLRDEVRETETVARTLIDADRPDLAARHLTLYSTSRAAEALSMGRSLVDGVEAMTRARFGIRRPETDRINDPGGQTPNCLVGADPDQPPGQP